MEYRKEIDGLRALAIIPVIFYHAGIGIFKGGFVGVDIFFVISGYLITSIIMRDVNENNFSFSVFYERRLRRIFPALFIVSLACFITGFAYIPPSDMQDLSKSLLRTFLFISNIYFYKHSGYFDLAAELKPLIHTWSLSVEEQYYILFPPLILFLYKFAGKKYIATITTIITFAGLVMSQHLLTKNPQASYYLIQSRGWEIMLGAILAIGLIEGKFFPGRSSYVHSEFFAFSGILLIIGSSVFLSKETIFPGVTALLPTVGAALVIVYAHQGTFTARLLKLRGFVLIGLISYSLYLWHQPVLAMARIVFSREPSPSETIVLLAFVFTLAYISWRWIEAPFRSRQRIGKAPFKVFVITGFFGVFTFGNWGAIDGFKGRFTELYEAHPKLLGVRKNPECLEENAVLHKAFKVCTFGDKTSASVVALWGDSHAEMLMGALDEKLKEVHVKGIRIHVKGCEPIPGIQEEDFLYAMRTLQQECAKKYEAAYEHIQKYAQSSIVSIRWTFHVYPVADQVNRMHFDNLEGGIEPGKSRRQVVLDANGQATIDGAAKKDAIHHLLQKLSTNHQSLILVYPVPEVGWDVPRMTLQNLIMNRHKGIDEITTSYDVYAARNQFIINTLDDWKSDRVHRIMPSEIFCKQSFSKRCVAQTGEVSYYSDDNHLSSDGAMLLAEKVAAIFRQ